MPSIPQHINQWKRNRDLLQRDSCIDFPEWKVTIAFYCALHAIEALFAHGARPLHFKEHKDRNRYLGDPQNKFLKIWTPYKILFDGSHDARYSCPDIGKRFPPPVLQELIQKKLRTVETEVFKTLGLPTEEFPHLKIDSATGKIYLDPSPGPSLAQ